MSHLIYIIGAKKTFAKDAPVHLCSLLLSPPDTLGLERSFNMAHSNMFPDHRQEDREEMRQEGTKYVD